MGAARNAGIGVGPEHRVLCARRTVRGQPRSRRAQSHQPSRRAVGRAQSLGDPQDGPHIRQVPAEPVGLQQTEESGLGEPGYHLIGLPAVDFTLGCMGAQ